jgi:Uma2 family endonuclease
MLARDSKLDEEEGAMATAARTRVVEYPTSDGKPMAETDLHRKEMMRLLLMLERWFAADRLIYVSGNLLVYFEEGNPRKHVAPDVFVVRGVPKKDRDYFLCWREGHFPHVIIEVTSKTTRREDMNNKFVLYRDVFKTKEYILFDPYGDYLNPRLQGYRLVKGRYVPMAQSAGLLVSNTLGLHLRAHEEHLQLINPATGEALLTPMEDAERERIGRMQAEKGQAELAAEIARLRRELGRKGNGSR